MIHQPLEGVALSADQSINQSINKNHLH